MFSLIEVVLNFAEAADATAAMLEPNPILTGLYPNTEGCLQGGRKNINIPHKQKLNKEGVE